MKRPILTLTFIPLTLLGCAEGVPDDAASETPEVESHAAELDSALPGARLGTPFGATIFANRWDEPGAASDDTKCHDCSTTPNSDPASQTPIDIADV